MNRFSKIAARVLDDTAPPPPSHPPHTPRRGRLISDKTELVKADIMRRSGLPIPIVAMEGVAGQEFRLGLQVSASAHRGMAAVVEERIHELADMAAFCLWRGKPQISDPRTIGGVLWGAEYRRGEVFNGQSLVSSSQYYTVSDPAVLRRFTKGAAPPVFVHIPASFYIKMSPACLYEVVGVRGEYYLGFTLDLARGGAKHQLGYDRVVVE